MVGFAHDGLELWYATADAPAPDGATVSRDDVSVTIGVRPASPGNSVRVRYRVDGGSPRIAIAILSANDFEHHIQYFRANLPTFWSGAHVEYVPILSNGGRRVPDPSVATTFPSGFGLADPDKTPSKPQPAQPRGGFPFELEYLVTKRITIARRPDLVGQTPAGFVLNWAPTGGVVDGPAFRATVHPEGEHELIIRPDGVGILSVRVTLETDDRALISVRYSGTVELGPDGAKLALREQWPAVARVHSAPRLLTSHPKYQWLNRLQCLGIGEIRPYELLYIYDLYAIR